MKLTVAATFAFIVGLVSIIAAPTPTLAADRQLQAFGGGNFYGWLRCSVPWHSCTNEEVARGVSAAALMAISVACAD